jgi:hypothetical protein
MAADEIDRDFPEQREILDGVPVPDPAVIFVEGDVEHPVQAVLDWRCENCKGKPRKAPMVPKAVVAAGAVVAFGMITASLPFFWLAGFVRDGATEIKPRRRQLRVPCGQP